MLPFFLPTFGAGVRRAPARSCLHSFKSHGPRDAVNFPGTQRKQHVTALKFSAANQIDDAQPGRDGPANVDALQVGLGND